MPAGARVAGKVGYTNYVRSGHSYSQLNDEIIWICIGMVITIAILISIALCYLLYDNCKRRKDPLKHKYA